MDAHLAGWDGTSPEPHARQELDLPEGSVAGHIRQFALALGVAGRCRALLLLKRVTDDHRTDDALKVIDLETTDGHGRLADAVPARESVEQLAAGFARYAN
ncbi:hypothetical protein EV643_110202 [Kribbella sp. VKM Ac-2527]|uniref:Uncharacterized protein n=1 Tax=Kribbella caucasensis TaxID=2512215 RepID=A0A4V3C9R7_9ACTN|nr:hypothetical protein [Kribbella sp. VKM Ac-2527]TDO46819.1 hypothetical protein EV643_110202 [Kribbella sp. VKM Ac-2527]